VKKQTISQSASITDNIDDQSNNVTHPSSAIEEMIGLFASVTQIQAKNTEMFRID